MFTHTGTQTKLYCFRCRLRSSLTFFLPLTKPLAVLFLFSQAFTTAYAESNFEKSTHVLLGTLTQPSSNTREVRYLTASPLAGPVFDLIQYLANNSNLAEVPDLQSQLPAYSRTNQFGGWVSENRPQDCYNTRARALIRDADTNVQVEFSPTNPCTVTAGMWHDPYTGTDFTTAKGVQIDHVVPLKNAYLTGAHAWNNEKRCHYTNFLRNGFHLLSVSGHENMKKGDASPERYMPPLTNFQCQYLKIWIEIKAIWQLGFSASEGKFIADQINTLGCNRSAYNEADSFLQDQRMETQNINLKCTSN